MNAKTTVELPTNDAEPVAALSELAHKAMMGMLMSGELAPNEVVTERQIALQLGISRTPLREAVRRLEGERFLERQRSGALVVRAMPVEEYMHILNVRRMLEGEAARLAAGRVPVAQLKHLKTRIGQALKLPEDVVTPEFAASDRDLHALIAQASGNPVLQQMIDDLKTRTSMFKFGRLPSRRKSVCAEHLEIIEALIACDGQRAQKAMQDHVDQVRLTILARLGGQ
ncbi:GntR family transcriptional regulator [Polaromonas sp. SM01]|uniref:GntR family transcriptional regulator n=1 Tax=Polaromonas sp. SM01 TaxID=3085630 RepID=UPI002980E5DD|nr:GntR family transcriptional regulator [Polaromonas sp. SM01]MDW5442359.1 GntR family transcriptional regulator [Polaromonas sp. SM01]